MTTQPPSLEPGSPAPARSRRRVADHPAAPSPSSRRPRRTCPEPAEGGTQQQPTPQAHRRTPAIRAPQPTVSSPYPSPPRPNRPLDRPELAQIERPAPSRVFWKKLLRAQSTPVSVSPFSNQEHPFFRHPGILSRDPAATSQPGLPCRPVSPITQAHRSLPAQPPDAKCSSIRPKKSASSYLWPAGPLWGPAGQR